MNDNKDGGVSRITSRDVPTDVRRWGQRVGFRLRGYILSEGSGLGTTESKGRGKKK